MRKSILLVLALVLTVALSVNPDCSLLSYRTIDGSCNNLKYPSSGQSGQYFVRFDEGAEYEDGISIPVDRGNPRNISNALGATNQIPGSYGPPQFEAPPKNTNSISMLEALLAQFINHDLERNDFLPNVVPGVFPLQLIEENVLKTTVYSDDVLYTEGASNNFIITSLSEGEISEETERFEIPNKATGWFDLSNIYGNDEASSDALRTFQDGLLKTSSYTVQLAPPPVPPVVYNNMPPSQNITGLPIDTPLSGDNNNIPTFGDSRGNENLVLFLVHTMFFREHNRLAINLKISHPSWDDETLFQEARRINIAVYQHIIFDSYLPLVLGNDVYNDLEKYEYDEEEIAETSMAFATGAFRYGHFTVGQWNIRDLNGCLYEYTIPAGVLGPFSITSSQLPNAGQLGGPFYPQLAIALSGGVDNVIMGLLKETGEEADIIMSEALRTVTFGGSIGAGIDIFVFDIVRGRLNGLPNYHVLRRNYYPHRLNREKKRNIYRESDCQANRNHPAIDPIECFLHINSDLEIATKLQSLYSKINNIDGVVGLMVEEKEEGKFLPPTASNIILKEYIRKRDADRFWYENGQFTDAEVKEIKARQFSDLVRDNLVSDNFPNMYDNMFQTPPDFGSYPICEE